MRSFEELVQEAATTPFVGFDLSFLEGRVEESPLSWDYTCVVRDRLTCPVLDMGTGGGELFATFAPFPGLAVATEAWPPNVSVAARRLRDVHGHVVQVESAPDNWDWVGLGGALPFLDGTFAMVINRHESYSPSEVYRVLKPGSLFVTQQVGTENDRDLRERFGSYEPPGDADGVAVLADQLVSAGFEVLDAREEFPAQVFLDVGALAWYMKAVSWEFPGYSIEGSREWLAEVDQEIRRSGGLVVRDHRLFVEARKPPHARASVAAGPGT